ncbi:coiled-coil domain-containing protein mad1, partial [Elasticomyces elasticus]
MDSGRSSRLSVSSLAEGAPPPPVLALRESLRHSTRPSQPTQTQRPDNEKEELRVQVNTLRYELENIKQERDVTALRHEKELRDLQLKADADFRKCQTAESSSHRANHKSEALAKELKEAQETTLNEKAGFERKIRTLNDQNQTLEEELGDTQAQLSDQERQFKYQINELDTVRSSLQRTIEDLQNDMQHAKDDLQTTQERLSEREATVANLETENIRLKAEGSDAETLAVLKRELSDQVHHMRSLETTNREQVVELRHLRKIQKNVEVVEEQKKSLENQLQLMKEVESELGTVQIQKQILEDERSSWTSLLQDNDQPAEFDSPDAVVKALLQERIEKAAFVDKLGTVEAQFLEKDEIIKSLETDRKTQRQELAKLQAAGDAANPMADSRVKARLERQRALAIKEVEYLRAQLKTFDTEEITMNADENRFDEQ